IELVQHRLRAVRVPPIRRMSPELRNLGFDYRTSRRHSCSVRPELVEGLYCSMARGKRRTVLRQAQDERLARIVMKFGGTSMAGIERIRSVATRVRREAEAGNEVLVVVSAMAGETDRLVQLCREAAALHDPTEYDVVVASGEQVTAGLLAMTLQNMGLKARSFMGWQLVKASGVHGNARVEAVESAMLDEALSGGTIAVIP